MAIKIEKKGKITLLVLLVVGLVLLMKWYSAKPKEAKEAVTVGKVTLPDAPEASLTGSATKLALPSQDVSANGGTKINWEIMAWNSQFPLMLANGGVQTTKGSLFDQAKLQINLVRQDNCDKSIADLVKFAEDLKEGNNPTPVICSYMGDGMPNFFQILHKKLESLGPDYQVIAFYAMGKSNGEDKLMAPVEWKRNPKAALGKTVSCYLRDGDMNILLKWAGDNGLKVNPDETTYDSSAINLVASADFLDAANKYITGYKESRRLIINGKKTSQTTEVGVDAVATWTPGDVNIATQKGGLVSIASTLEYSTQMPNISITIKKWAYDHRTDIENIIISLAQAGDQVRSFTDIKEFAAKTSAKVYNEKDGAYWLKYYNGTQEKDIQGLNVALGGSMAFNLVDAANTFGLGKDGLDRYKVVYNTFGDILSKMYPEFLKTYPKYETSVDKSFLNSVISNHPELLQGQSLQSKVEYSTEITSTVSEKSYQILFETGSDKIKPESYSMLNEIFSSAVVAENLTLSVNGHTDNAGSDVINIPLSEKRAESVKRYLVSKGLKNKQVITKGFGSTNPIADNSTEAGKTKNRRVEIVLGQ